MNMPSRTLLVALSLSFALVPLTGCKSAEEREAARREKAAAKEAKEQEAAAKLQAAQNEIKAKIPADSPLAKIEFGQSEAEVAVQLGVPTSQRQRVTGKAFNPFNVSGRDTVRTIYYYQGMGRVEFSSGSWGRRFGVVNIVHDPNEPGAEPPKDKK